MDKNTPRFYHFGDFRLDTKRRILFKNDQQIPLTSRLYDLLCVLVKSDGQILEHDQLLDEVWEGAFVEQSNLKKSISALRQILGEQANESRYISTIPRRGYSFVADVRAVDETETVQYKEVEREIIIEEVYEDDSNPPHEIIVTQALPSKAPTFFSKYKVFLLASIILLFIGITTIYFGGFNKKTLAGSLSLSNLRVQKLTTSGNVQEAGFSPDGQVVVYAIEQADGKQSLWTRRVAAPNAIQIAEPANVEYRAVAISPDNNYVYYGVGIENSRDVLYKVSVLGGVPRKITENIQSAVSFSPDAKRIAFVRDKQDIGRTLLTANAEDGSDEKEIYTVKDNHNLINPVWSPDGKKFVFVSSDVTDKGRIWELKEIPVDGGTPRSLTVAKKGKIFLARWFSDGSGLVITAKPDDLSQSQIWRVDYPNGQMTRLTNDVLDYFNIEVNHNADSLLTLQQERIADLWSAGFAKPNDLTQITHTQNLLGEIMILPDNRILLGETENGQRVVTAINEDGSNSQPFLNRGDVYRPGDFLPKSNTFLFTSLRTGTEQIFQSDLNGNNAQKMTDEKTFIINPRYSPDGKFIYYNRIDGIPWKLVRKSTETGEISLITNAPSMLYNFSSDGNFLAHNFYDETEKRWRVAIRKISDNSVQKILDIAPASFICWTPDGKSLLYNTSDVYFEGGNVWQKALDDSPPKLFLDAKTEKIYNLVFSKDGQKFYITRGKLNSNLVLLTKEKSE